MNLYNHQINGCQEDVGKFRNQQYAVRISCIAVTKAWTGGKTFLHLLKCSLVLQYTSMFERPGPVQVAKSRLHLSPKR